MASILKNRKNQPEHGRRLASPPTSLFSGGPVRIHERVLLEFGQDLPDLLIQPEPYEAHERVGAVTGLVPFAHRLGNRVGDRLDFFGFDSSDLLENDLPGGNAGEWESPDFTQVAPYPAVIETLENGVQLLLLLTAGVEPEEVERREHLAVRRFALLNCRNVLLDNVIRNLGHVVTFTVELR